MIKLLDYQKPHAEQIWEALCKQNSALDASDTGTGKTYSTIDVAKRWGKPILVMCPKVLIPTWKRLLDAEGLRNGVVNYELARNGNTPFIDRVRRKYKGKDTSFFKWPGDMLDWLVVCDEVHRCRTQGSLNGKMLRAAKRQGMSTMLLSATAAQSPLDMYNTGFALNLFQQDEWDSWVYAHGARRLQMGKGPEFWHFDPLAEKNRLHLQHLHEALFPSRGSRMRIAELGDAFPETRIIVETYNFDKALKPYKALQKKIDEVDDKAIEAVNDLTFLLYERMKVELSKVPGIVELANDNLAEGNNVVIFVNFTETRLELMERLKTDCAIYGDMPGQPRQKSGIRQHWIDQFNADKERVIVVNLQAGGTGLSLHDTHGNYPRVALISPTFSAFDLKQVFGRVWRSGGRSRSTQRLLYAANTIEEDVCRKVAAKLHNIDIVNGLDSLTDDDLNILKAMQN